MTIQASISDGNYLDAPRSRNLCQLDDFFGSTSKIEKSNLSSKSHKPLKLSHGKDANHLF